MGSIKILASTVVELSGQIALVTGGGTGIGLMLAQGLAENGAKVYITGRPNALKVVEEKEGRLDILVNNAGAIGPRASYLSDDSAPENSAIGASLFQDQSFEAWLASARIRGPKETSSVINISTTWSTTKLPFEHFAYVASKAGQDRLTVSLATQFAIKGLPVRVNAFAPGIFPSGMTLAGQVEADKLATGRVCGAMNPNPLKRAGRPHEIALMAVMLCFRAGAFINGQIIGIDGGHNLVNP
ncbi:NAD(P)-binding protein [Gymnopus androsaceus JB14]|uniref:NAD(P)-binding protein n=1 Tax=Gymnopus androsaceus JB14 TaxID=1447944 RepID=A0A6A4HRY4_9AGAR|nr:NAD(P)-binding protein [Gymnopus androsaceus JB14]